MCHEGGNMEKFIYLMKMTFMTKLAYVKAFWINIAGTFAPDYEVLRAVDRVDFSIEKGEAVGYVGPNGSGKSTTIKMLCGILKPTEGSVRINGLDPFQERVRNSKEIGVVFGNRSILWWTSR